MRVQSSPIAFAFLHKLAPGSAVLRIWAVRPIYTKVFCLGSAALPLLLFKTNKPGGQAVFGLGYLPCVPTNSPSHLITCGVPATSGVQMTTFLIALGFSGRCKTTSFLQCFLVSINIQVPLCCHSIIRYFIECNLSNFALLILLGVFKSVYFSILILFEL